MAGLVAAVAFGHAGFSVCLVDPASPVTSSADQGSDLRSTAFLRPAKALFEQIGLWPQLEPHAVPLEQLRIVDTAGDPPEIRDERSFGKDGSGDHPLGWNFMNWLIRRELLAHLDKQTGVVLRYGTGFSGMLTRIGGAIVTLSDGGQIAARLVIGADGRFSPVRDAAGIGAHTIRYGQKSLAFVASHIEPHHNISTEIYNFGGPFTMVPLAPVNGIPASAIVWMNAGRRTLDLAAMEPGAFNTEMTRRSAGLFGPMELVSPRAIWPIITQRADRLTAERTALIAEAAHVLPPIGAQGLNTSLNDISALLAAAMSGSDDLGGPAMLEIYDRARYGDIARRARAIDMFNRVTRSGGQGLQSLRLAGLKAAYDIVPVRQGLIRAGMGPG